MLMRGVPAGTGKITGKMLLFLESYLANGGNATKAAISAGYSESSARSQGNRLTTNANILAELDRRRSALVQKALWARENSVRTLAEIAMNAEKDADKIRAVAELNEMHGYNAPQKIERNGTITRIELVPLRSKPGLLKPQPAAIERPIG